jgi:hypothetical protein
MAAGPDGRCSLAGRESPPRVPRADPERAAEDDAEDLSGVPLLATAATTSFDLGVVLGQSQRKVPLW